MKKLALLALTAALGVTAAAGFAAEKKETGTSAPVTIHKAKRAEKKVTVAPAQKAQAAKKTPHKTTAASAAK
ncbi:MAG TPA: hypothetical protein VJ642_08065 [Chromobacteriaceae bacterium]|nr:hypothetical protein [Chromobacteriaceae bacterium]